MKLIYNVALYLLACAGLLTVGILIYLVVQDAWEGHDIRSRVIC